MPQFKIVSDFKPTGDQPQAIEKLVKGLDEGKKHQVLLGVTGSGKSVVKKTPVLIKSSDGKIVSVDIGDFIDKMMETFKTKVEFIGDSEVVNLKDLPLKHRFQTYSFDPASKNQSWRPVNQISRHHCPEELYKVKTACGREVTVTGNHNFFALRNGELALFETTELTCKDYLPVPLELKPTEKPLESILSNDYLSSVDKLYVLMPQFSSVWKTQQNDLRQYLSYSHVHALLHESGRVPISKYKQLLTVNPVLSQDAKIGTYNHRTGSVKLEVPLDKDILRLLGYYLAEGHAEKGYTIISSADSEIVSDLITSLNFLGIKVSRRPGSYDYVCYSTLLSDLFKNWCGRDSQTKHLPSFWMQLSNSQLSNLLRAYFSGDGGIDGDEVTCTTASSQLASDLAYALLRFKIIARIKTRNIKLPNSDKRKKYFTVRISSRNYLSSFIQNIGFTLARKREKLATIISDNYHTNVDIIPVNGKWLKKIRLGLNLSQLDLAKPCHLSRSYISMIEDDKRYFSRNSFEQIMKFLRQQALRADRIGLAEEIKDKNNLLNLYWTPIKDIKKIPGENYVYDFAVENNENFLAGLGGIFVHNTFTMANVIEKVQKPTLVISHNKTLAGQLAQEFRSLFPSNAVEYFVSYYDYYQPEAYIPQSDTYIEKDAQINEEIEKLRLSATASLMTRKDVVVVASVSAIYNLGSPVEYGQAILELKAGMKTSLDQMLLILNKMYYSRNDIDFKRSTFRLRGDTLDIFPSYKDEALRIEFLGDKVEKVSLLAPLTGKVTPLQETQVVYPAKHYITPEQRLPAGLLQIEEDLEQRVKELKKQGKLLEAQRLEQRTHYDLEYIKEFGYCNGIENYSRYFDGRSPGDPPYTLLHYFPKDFLIIIDESHMSLPQIRGMYNGDRARKETLIEYGFRLPSALDNRPLKFEEFMRMVNQVIYTSATPDNYELSLAGQDGVSEQLVRPTGILDPEISIRPIEGQIDDLLLEIQKRVEKKERVLVTTLTKRMAEDLAEYLEEKAVKVHYLHSDVETLKRSDILQSLRLGEFDVIVGINLLREGLDLPEVSLVAILDADKEGFLRSRTSLIQTMGRAARHINGQVIMYADNITGSMKAAIDEVERRRKYQADYNQKHGLKPQAIVKPMRDRLIEKVEEESGHKVLSVEDIPDHDKKVILKSLEEQMKQAADILDFETAAKLRDQIKELTS